MRCVWALKSESFAWKMFATNVCGLRSMSGNQLLCTCDHDAVSFAKLVILRVEVDDVFVDVIRRDRLGMLEALSEAAAKDVVRDHELVAVELLVGLDLCPGRRRSA